MTLNFFLLGMNGEHKDKRFPLRPDFKDSPGLHKLVVSDVDGNSVTLTARKDGTLRVKGDDSFALAKEVNGRFGLVDKSLNFKED